ncbi:AbrB family transcriptional regulator [Staphylococcus sp. SQ8-PEA]|uniref:AbrB family transcriptional regulator n=1 Tax=Staphylococcus marylandisciuri TaxID=2981529 RepID=A0ABT2QQL4_9STAP|nr:AbrB family transcriptional regulator [Staphylococcus marylandisciuri]MCU5746269.1 AbrB family transcriptional regulator [Staphylococcus marylandisciuri]
MDTVKARKQGNAVMVTLAKKFNVPEGKEFFVTKEDDGTISLIPKVDDYFENAEPGQFIDQEDTIAKNFSTRGNELDNEN